MIKDNIIHRLTVYSSCIFILPIITLENHLVFLYECLLLLQYGFIHDILISAFKYMMCLNPVVVGKFCQMAANSRKKHFQHVTTFWIFTLTATSKLVMPRKQEFFLPIINEGNTAM